VPGWVGSTRRARLPADWPARRRACRNRAGGHCEWQRVLAELPALAAWARGRDIGGDPGHLHGQQQHAGAQADHVHRGDDHQPDKLAWLCAAAHAAKSGWEGGTARPTLRRPPEPHPGLI
jgi:5-methylcytosine-specific restriction enzyme A